MFRKKLFHLSAVVVVSFGNFLKAVIERFTLIYIRFSEWFFPSPKLLFDPP